MKNFSTLDKAASGVILVCVTIVGFVIFLGEQAGIRVKTSLPEDGLIGPYQVITFTFSEAVDPQMTESLFDIQPKINGKFQWVDSQTLQFAPSKPFALGTPYKLTLRSGILSKNNSKLKKDLSWDLHGREPLLAYLNTKAGQSSIWVMDLNNGSPRQLTDSIVKVMGFDASRDGEFIVFYAVNKTDGADLWRVTRSGASSILLDCGHDRCTTPTISPDGTRVAYSREAAGLGPNLPYGSPRVWMLDITSGKDGPIYQDQQVLGYGPEWSPDGTQLASFDGIADQIRLLNIASGELFIFSSNTGSPVTWSPDGTKLLFTDAEQYTDGLRTRVRMADLTLNKTYTLFGDKDEFDYGYGSIAWSPLDKDVALLEMRSSGDDPTGLLWLFDPGQLDGIIIAKQPNYIYNFPHWNVWGDALIFQQIKLKSVPKPEIGFWKKGLREPQVIAEGLTPHWLP
jgi:hypothetical protein